MNQWAIDYKYIIIKILYQKITYFRGRGSGKGIGRIPNLGSTKKVV